MTPVKILHVNAVRALELRDQLQDSGLTQNQDFEWEYRQAEYDNFGYEAAVPRHVTFRFRDPALATFWQLKWS
jgi:uncharacterized protein YccT (UPF0319 family)